MVSGVNKVNIRINVFIEGITSQLFTLAVMVKHETFKRIDNSSKYVILEPLNAGITNILYNEFLELSYLVPEIEYIAMEKALMESAEFFQERGYCPLCDFQPDKIYEN